MRKVVILGTGGTIAGTADRADRPWSYQAATLGVAELVARVPALAGLPLVLEQVAQVDSKDMGWAVWRALGQALQQHLACDEVAGVVITHGTDTLEETAYWLHHLVDGSKPVVLTAAMRPATAPDADGPVNLRDAVRVALEASTRGLGGVVAVLAGRVWAGAQVRKAHTTARQAFDAGECGPLAVLDDSGHWKGAAVAWPRAGGGGWGSLALDELPRVELVFNHVDADGWLVDAALAHSRGALRGLVVACTGHGTVSVPLAAALQRAQHAGVLVWRATRVAAGGVGARAGDVWPACGTLTPAQARVALILHLLGHSPVLNP